MKKVLLIFLLSFVTLFTTACGFGKKQKVETQVKPVVKPKNAFGTFGYNGNWLTEKATKNIDYEKATSMINKSSSNRKKTSNSIYLQKYYDDIDDPTIYTKPEDVVTNDEDLNYYLSQYSCINVTTKYYNETTTVMQSKQDSYQGNNMSKAIKENIVEPYSQVCARYLVINYDLLFYMEKANDEWKKDPMFLNAPFKDKYSYHTNGSGNLVVKVNEYKDMPSLSAGGMGCSFIQNTEIVYDADLKATLWQTSLGLRYQTPNGTVSQGYIFEMSFDWTVKV